MSSSEEHVLATFKIIVIGDSAVGKSSILRRFINDEFDEKSEMTIGIDFSTKIIEVDGNRVKLALWDSAGQERFRSLTPTYYRNTQAAILVYDVTSRGSFNNLQNWMEDLHLHSNGPEMVKMVIGNKVDKEVRIVSRNDGERFAAKHRAFFMETSAKTNESITFAFEEIARKILETPRLWEAANTTFTTTLIENGNRDEAAQSWCC